MVHVVELGGVALHRYVFRALPFQSDVTAGRVPWPQGGGRRKPGTAPCVRWRPYSPACSFTSWRSRHRTRACFAAAMPGSSPTMTQATAIAQIYGSASMRALATPSIRAPRFRNGLPRAPQACLPRALPAPGCPKHRTPRSWSRSTSCSSIPPCQPHVAHERCVQRGLRWSGGQNDLEAAMNDGQIRIRPKNYDVSFVYGRFGSSSCNQLAG